MKLPDLFAVKIVTLSKRRKRPLVQVVAERGREVVTLYQGESTAKAQEVRDLVEQVLTLLDASWQHVDAPDGRTRYFFKGVLKGE